MNAALIQLGIGAIFGGRFSPPAPYPGGGGYAPDPIWKNEKNPAIEIKFPISLSIAPMPEDKRSAR
jgi:hypothetical protein